MELSSRLAGGQPRLTRSQVRIFCGNTRRMNISKARNELGYSPRDPETALRQAFEYLQKAG